MINVIKTIKRLKESASYSQFIIRFVIATWSHSCKLTQTDFYYPSHSYIIYIDSCWFHCPYICYGFYRRAAWEIVTYYWITQKLLLIDYQHTNSANWKKQARRSKYHMLIRAQGSELPFLWRGQFKLIYSVI